MTEYFFVFGRYPEISLAELQSVFEKYNLNFSLIHQSKESAVFSFTPPGRFPEIFPSLGGSIKFGRILGEVNLSAPQTDFYQYFDGNYLKENVIPGNTKKIHFGISVYDGGGEIKIIKELENSLSEFLKQIKNNLNSIGLKSGFLRIKGRNLSSVAVEKNGLLNKGFEMSLIVCGGKIIIGKTQAVQDYESFAQRDMERPRKDKRSGIMPVKLARMMVNLASPDSNSRLLDPFCGSGTILMEAVLIGVKHIFASDISPAAISNSEANLEWLFRKYNLNRQNFNLKLQIADIRNLEKISGLSAVDAIVTEPFLGPPLYMPPDENQSKNIIAQLSPLYRDSLIIFRRLLSSGGKIVMIFPFIRGRDNIYFLDKKIIQNSNFRILNSFLYSSPGQFIGREIIVMEKS